MKRETDFFFEEWAFLARIDPEAFERRRLKAIDEFLSMSCRQRILGEMLQHQIDATRVQAGNPQAALQALAKMLGDELVFLGEELNLLSDHIDKLRRSG